MMQTMWANFHVQNVILDLRVRTVTSDTYPSETSESDAYRSL